MEYISLQGETATAEEEDRTSKIRTETEALNALPVGFISKDDSKGKKSRTLNAGARVSSGKEVALLPKSKGDKFVVEHNLMMCTHPADGLMYPARILGNGPSHLHNSSSDGTSLSVLSSPVLLQSVMVSFLTTEYAAPNERTMCIEVLRRPYMMAPIPASYTAQIRRLLEVERCNTSGDVFAELSRRKHKNQMDSNVGTNSNSLAQQAVPSLPVEIINSIDLSDLHEKYWDQRYRFFSKYDRGVLLDAESWFSVTPEVISRHIVSRCESGMRRLIQEAADAETDMHRGKVGIGGTAWASARIKFEKEARAAVDGAVAVDVFSGCGGDTIAMARVFSYVLANDIDPLKVQLLRHNATLHGVANRIEGLCGDAYDLLEGIRISANIHAIDESDLAFHNTSSAPFPPTGSDTDIDTDTGIHELRKGLSSSLLGGPADVLVLAPPWGGSEYTDQKEFDLHTMIPSGDFFELIKLTRHIAANIVCILPKNTPKRQIEEISTTILNKNVHPCMVEDVYINHKCKMTVVYFGLLFAPLPRMRVGPRKRKANGDCMCQNTVHASSPSISQASNIYPVDAVAGQNQRKHFRFNYSD